MLPEERRIQLMNLLKERHFLSTAEISQRLSSSPATIRRDLALLAERGQISRVRGGAMDLSEQHVEWPYLYREQVNEQAKEYLAELALAHIQDGQSLFLDSSSTVFKLAKKLQQRKHLKILTNGNLTSYILGIQTKHDIYTLGGKIHNQELSITGGTACSQVAAFSADTTLISCRGLSARGGSDATEEEAQVKQAFFQRAQKVILLMDHSKLNHDFFYSCLTFEQIDCLITDQPLPRNLQKIVSQYPIEVVY